MGPDSSGRYREVVVIDSGRYRQWSMSGDVHWHRFDCISTIFLKIEVRGNFFE